MSDEIDQKTKVGQNTRLFLRFFSPAHFDHWKLRKSLMVGGGEIRPQIIKLLSIKVALINILCPNLSFQLVWFVWFGMVWYGLVNFL